MLAALGEYISDFTTSIDHGKLFQEAAKLLGIRSSPDFSSDALTVQKSLIAKSLFAKIKTDIFNIFEKSEKFKDLTSGEFSELGALSQKLWEHQADISAQFKLELASNYKSVVGKSLPPKILNELTGIVASQNLAMLHFGQDVVAITANRYLESFSPDNYLPSDLTEDFFAQPKGFIVGSVKSDRFVVDGRGVAVFSGPGADYIDVGLQPKVNAGSGDDNVVINISDAVYFGSVNGGPGIDTLMLTGGGVDGSFADLSYGYAGALGLEHARETLVVGFENVSGTSGGDTISGNTGANVLKGQKGADYIRGFGGRDALIGGLGIDYLVGGTGADKFVFTNSTEGGDKITDFELADVFQFEGSAFNLGTYHGTLKAANFIARTTGHAAGDANDYFIFDKKLDQLWFDDDGKGAHKAVMIADLTNNFNLTAGDILIV